MSVYEIELPSKHLVLHDSNVIRFKLVMKLLIKIIINNVFCLTLLCFLFLCYLYFIYKFDMETQEKYFYYTWRDKPK